MYTTRIAKCLEALALVTVSIAQGSAQTQPQQQEPSVRDRVAKGFGIGIKLMSTVGGMPGPIAFSNIPQNLRTIPSNQYGPLAAGTPVTVPNSTITVGPGAASLLVGLGAQYTVSRLTMRGGALAEFANVTSSLPSVSTTATYATFPEINQFGTNERGVGTSLVFYDIYWAKIPPAVTPFGELELRISHSMSLLGGYIEHRNAAANLENGYDQYDALTAYTSQKLASATADNSVYGGVRFAVFGPYAGLFIGAMPVKWAQISSPYPITAGFIAKSAVQLFFWVWILAGQMSRNTEEQAFED